MLKNVIQAAPACPDQVRSEWSNQIARAKDFLTRVVERETRHASKSLQLLHIESTVRRPQMLQSNQPAWFHLPDSGMLGLKVLKKFCPVGK
jgi:hypothetical protein